MPARGAVAEQVQDALLQRRVARARRGAREFLGRAGNDFALKPHKTEKLDRQVVPGALVFARSMDDSADVGAREEKADDVRDDFCRRRVAALVVNDLERRPLLCAKLRHRVDEARPAGAVEPCDAEDNRVGHDHVDHLLAREL